MKSIETQDIRQYEARANATRTFGRVVASCRDHHFVVDGPVQNGCPGEAVTPAELFLSSVACCGVELVQVLAKAQGAPLSDVAVHIHGWLDRAQPVRPDVTLFHAVRLTFELRGVSEEQAGQLVASFKAR